MSTLDEILELLKNHNLSLDDIKCFSIAFYNGIEKVETDYGSFDEPKYKTINLPTYEGNNKPALYDDYREFMFEDIAKIASIEGFGMVWLNNGGWLFRNQPHMEEVYHDDWQYETIPLIPNSLILDIQGNPTPEQV